MLGCCGWDSYCTRCFWCFHFWLLKHTFLMFFILFSYVVFLPFLDVYVKPKENIWKHYGNISNIWKQYETTLHQLLICFIFCNGWERLKPRSLKTAWLWTVPATSWFDCYIPQEFWSKRYSFGKLSFVLWKCGWKQTVRLHVFMLIYFSFIISSLFLRWQKLQTDTQNATNQEYTAKKH